MKFEGLQAALTAALLVVVVTGCTSSYQGLAAPNVAPTAQASLPGTAALTGIVDEFAVGAGASLTEIGAVTVPGAVGGEGIVAF